MKTHVRVLTIHKKEFIKQAKSKIRYVYDSFYPCMCTYNLFNIFFNKKSRKHITHIIYSSTNNLENAIQIHIGIGFSNRKTLAIVGLSLFISLIHISAISKYSFTWASIRPPSHKILASTICICLS